MVENPRSACESVGCRRDLALLAILFALVIPLRVGLFFNTEVPARDCIGYVRYALQFEEKPWKEVVAGNHQHPGYPLSVWAVSMPVRALVGGVDPDTMRVSAQIASGIAAILLLLPMYFLGKALFDRSIAFWGTLLFQYLPTSGHHLSDGISEALFLLLLTTALLWGVLAMRSRSPWRFALCGLFGGLAYLTRPEGALMLPAVGLVLAACQMIAPWRVSMGRFLACGASLTVAAALIVAVYVATTGRLSNKPVANDILGSKFGVRDQPAAYEHAPRLQGHVFASVFGAFFEKTDAFWLRLGRSLRALFSELSQAFHYVGGVLAILGLWWSWDRLRGLPEFWPIAAYLLIHSAILVALAMVAFYVSDRHVMPLVQCGCYFVAAAARELPRRLLGRCGVRDMTPSLNPWWRDAGVWSLVVMLALVGIALPKTLQRLHGNRGGNLAAGKWLAEHLVEGDYVDDDHAWSHYYAGMVFKEGKDRPLPKGFTPTNYVVVTRAREGRSDQIRLETEQKVLILGPVVYHWPANQDVERATVIVVAAPRDMKKHPWHVAP
ncbi:MAG: glycosyltransferase family 39 protein [Planctomycetes bacterium]|nr:glycosyltransferase family 39 protein [Planctomycetota bacterium]